MSDSQPKTKKPALKTVALLGGSFNPPHLGHLEILKDLCRNPRFDEIWILPVHRHPFGKDLAPYEMRETMIRLLLEDVRCRKIKISSLEKELNRTKNYTYDTLSHLKSRYPQTQFVLVLGSDAKKQLPQWHRHEDLKREVEFYFMPRQGYEPSHLPQVSSSQIRERLRNGQDITGLTTKKIADYLQKMKLSITNKPMPSRIKKIFVVYKRSVYQKYILDETEHESHGKIKALLKKKHFAAKSLISAHEQHKRALEQILSVLDKKGVFYQTETRHKLTHIQDCDLVLTVGGDGTFFRSAHYVKNQLIMGINSAPAVSVGALCSINCDQFEEKIDAILAGDYQVQKLARIRILLNGMALPFEAVNDVLFTNVSPAATSRYYIQYGRIREEHKSSGVWIATPVGSGAAINAAGGMKMHRLEKRLQFLAREPYQGTYNSYRLVRGFIDPGKKLKIVDKMIKSRIFIDGPTIAFDLHYGDELLFGLSKQPLRVIL